MRKTSIASDGRREKIRPADVDGRFTRARRWFFYLLIGVYALVPWIEISGAPAIFLDIEHRRFFLFGFTFIAQDAYLLFFVITGGMFSLFFLTALVGRLWCGWACPHTVFLEGVFRPIERWIEGSRADQLALARAPWTAQKIAKRIAKHALYLLSALVVAHIFISYFVSLPRLFEFVRHDPRAHWTAFVWMSVLTGIMYFHFSWFREQICLVVCPYGKAQSFLLDDDSLIIGYDTLRGEPRGRKGTPNAGACVNCNRCVDVCPTGIDIRNGLQLECIGCANCVDACDAIMDKLDRPRGLIRYDSFNGLDRKPRRILRPRVYLYTVLLLIGVAVMTFTVSRRKPFEANILRLTQTPYTIDAGVIRNQFKMHLFNKQNAAAQFVVTLHSPANARVIFPISTVSLEPLRDQQVPFFVEMPEAEFGANQPLILQVTNTTTGDVRQITTMFLGPAASGKNH